MLGHPLYSKAYLRWNAQAQLRHCFICKYSNLAAWIALNAVGDVYQTHHPKRLLETEHANCLWKTGKSTWKVYANLDGYY
jgi:hypothetical protein